MARNSHIVFDGYSYEPPSYEEAQAAQASASGNQSVYKPTVSQSQDTSVSGFRPLYTPNGYNGLTEYNLAKRRRRMRIAVAIALGIFCFIILIAILFWNINSAYHVAHKYNSYIDKSDEDLKLHESSIDSSILNNNDFYPWPVNDNKPIQDSDDDVLDKTEDKVNLENHNDPFTNDGGFNVGNDWEKDSQKILEKLQSENFGIHFPNIKDEKESPVNQNYDKFLTDVNEYIRHEMEKLNMNQFEDNSANTGKENSAEKNPFDFNKFLQKESEKLNTGENSDNVGDNNFFNSDLQKEIEKLNLKSMASSSRNPTITPDKAAINIFAGKSLDELASDLLISHVGNADLNKAHDLLKSLKVDNDNH